MLGIHKEKPRVIGAKDFSKSFGYRFTPKGYAALFAVPPNDGKRIEIPLGGPAFGLAVRLAIDGGVVDAQ